MELPGQFTERTKSLFGALYGVFLEALNEESPVSIRSNPSKEAKMMSGDPVPWASGACYLPSRPSFTMDPLFHAGCYYVQEASSMFLEQIIKSHIKEPVRCLDLCAAPGGKSTHLVSVLPQGSLLVANEVIRSRSHILSENLIKWGNSSVVVTNNDPGDFGGIRHFFDLILIDAPCSGEGMFRKDKEAVSEWSLNNVFLCAERQRRVIADCWNSLKPGGFLIYSTCTYNTEENEDNVRWIVETLGAEVLSVPVDDSWGIVSGLKYTYPVYRFIPGKTKGEGFFIAVLQKGEEGQTYKNINNHLKNKGREKRTNVRIPGEITAWLNSPETYCFEEGHGVIRAIPVEHQSAYSQLKDLLRIIHAGIEIGEIKGKDKIPSHSLAMSVDFNRNAFPLFEADMGTAISFLRKESFILPSGIPKGYVLPEFQGQLLGFMKNIGNRANNLYPQTWRIRKAI